MDNKTYKLEWGAVDGQFRYGPDKIRYPSQEGQDINEPTDEVEWDVISENITEDKMFEFMQMINEKYDLCGIHDNPPDYPFPTVVIAEFDIFLNSRNN